MDFLVSNELEIGDQAFKNCTSLSSLRFEPIVNKSGSMLPETGGVGTKLLLIGGGILVLAAGILLVTKKRMSAYE